MDGGYWVKCRTYSRDCYLNLENVISVEAWPDGTSYVRVGAGEKNHVIVVQCTPEELMSLPRFYLPEAKIS